MMQDEHVRLNPHCHGQSGVLQGKGSFHQQIRPKYKEKLVKCNIWCTALCGAENWTLRTADQKYLESFEMWSWETMDIIWTDLVRNEEVFHRINEEKKSYIRKHNNRKKD
jgi:hypothetical protein